jgi:hypothetical protein
MPSVSPHSSDTRWNRQSAESVGVKSNQRRNKGNVMSSSHRPEPRPVIPARLARGGVTGHNVRFVLGFSIAAVVIVFAIIWFVYFA